MRSAVAPILLAAIAVATPVVSAAPTTNTVCTSPQANHVQTPNASNNYGGIIVSSAGWNPEEANATSPLLTPVQGEGEHPQVQYACTWQILCPKGTKFSPSYEWMLFSDGSILDPTDKFEKVASTIRRTDTYAKGDPWEAGGQSKSNSAKSSMKLYLTGNETEEIAYTYAAACRIGPREDTLRFTTLSWEYNASFKQEGFQLSYWCMDENCGTQAPQGAVQPPSRTEFTFTKTTIIVTLAGVVGVVLLLVIVVCFGYRRCGGGARRKQMAEAEAAGGGHLEQRFSSLDDARSVNGEIL